MSCKREINYNNYIEIIPRGNNKVIDIFKKILRYENKLTIDDFNLDLKCTYPRFFIYKDKTDIYINRLFHIERELHELYKEGIIQYAGYQ